MFVIGLFWLGFKEDKLIIHSDKIELEGFYGEELTSSDIESIELVDKVPKITMKTNGFALGNIHKGYFRTNDGEIIKLIANSDNKTYILITKKSGKKIYFSAKSTMDTFEEIKKNLPDIVYKQ